ncbi:adenosylcobinamide-GDP ribazoletransferase [Carboxylicivirga linearis]|uniref:Adenosylcobinamide-GDP ribazoletransferase n=1 Tax=Carboxylicivirga linearis TaxID=1628157 RepID=A0ABS5JR21_9BACT|nr:adenosylcobinamide-GDP ribazoletransferase [Carboxylicivirga linearis]MBS2097319.1 adenosylcobinamide-GDP ribazoletransferase [Carboxylicivirga linearis]
MKHQINLILTAFGFFTRIPIPFNIAFSQENLNKCNRYFPLVGYFVGGAAALIYWLATFLFPDSLAILLSMAASILLTGAFHEDGFADVCDAFGGGWTKEKILVIMKDSRVGAYGAIGIILLLISKYTAISSIPTGLIALSMIVAHVNSRFMAVWTMHTLPYVREDESSKSKPITKSLHHKDLLIAFVLTIPSLFILADVKILFIIPLLIVSKLFLEQYFKKWIGGYTGDCLGTIQQTCELVIYLTLVAIYYSKPLIVF